MLHFAYKFVIGLHNYAENVDKAIHNVNKQCNIVVTTVLLYVW